MTGKNQQALDWLERHVIMPHEIKQTVYAALKQPEVELRPLPESHHDYTDDNWFDAGWNACVEALQQPGDKT